MENVRRGKRIKRPRRPFSPDDGASTLATEKVILLHSATLRSEKKHGYTYDLDTTGKKFQCDSCNSNFIVDPRKRKYLTDGQKNKRRRYSPRYGKDPVTGKNLKLCNACGLKLSRPVVKAKSAVVKGMTEKERNTYSMEVKQFTDMLEQQFNDKDAENLFCPNITNKNCGCVQNYITGGGKDDVLIRARHLLQICKKARYLSSLKFAELTKVCVENRCHSKHRKKIGLGNGQKKSNAYLQFVLENRKVLRKEFTLCEKACQRIMGYSNNLLYRKLKTESNKQRIEPLRQMKTFSEISKESCCTNNCVTLVDSCEKLVGEWRTRYQMSQTERRRVIAEMLTPVAGSYHNCYKFIQFVTGCSANIIAKVSKHLEMTDWDREPPEHGLKKYWEKQQQKNSLLNSKEHEASSIILQESSTCGQFKKIVLTQSQKSTSDGVFETQLCHNMSVDEPSLYPPNKTVTSDLGTNSYHKPDTSINKESDNSILKILPTLEKKREEILRLQKELESKQNDLKCQQDAIERDMIKALQCQKLQYIKERKLSGDKTNGNLTLNVENKTELTIKDILSNPSTDGKKCIFTNSNSVNSSNSYCGQVSSLLPSNNNASFIVTNPTNSLQPYQNMCNLIQSDVIRNAGNTTLRSESAASNIYDIEPNLAVVQVLSVDQNAKKSTETCINGSVFITNNVSCVVGQTENSEKSLIYDSEINGGVFLLEEPNRTLVAMCHPESNDVSIPYSCITEVHSHSKDLATNQLNLNTSNGNNGGTGMLNDTSPYEQESVIEKSKDVLLSSVASTEEKLGNLVVDNQLSRVSNDISTCSKHVMQSICPSPSKRTKYDVSPQMLSNFKTKNKNIQKRPRRHSLAVMNNIGASNKVTP